MSTFLHHFHAVLQGHREVENVLQGAGIDHSREGTLEGFRNRIVHVMDQRGLLVVRRVHRGDLPGAQVSQQRLSVSARLAEQPFRLRRAVGQTGAAEQAVQRHGVDKQLLPANHRRAVELHATPMGGEQELYALNVEAHGLSVLHQRRPRCPYRRSTSGTKSLQENTVGSNARWNFRGRGSGYLPLTASSIRRRYELPIASTEKHDRALVSAARLMRDHWLGFRYSV